MLSLGLSLYIFNVGAGQCIFVYPYNDLNYCTLIDCGCDNRVLNFVKSRLPKVNNANILGNLTLTNYDEDHFSGISAISQQNIKIKTICFAHNLECEEIRQLKTEETPNLKKILHLKKTYDHNVLNWNPPYKKHSYCLDKSDLEEYTTNNLSQMVFLEYRNFMMCVPGDLEQEGWKKI